MELFSEPILTREHKPDPPFNKLFEKEPKFTQQPQPDGRQIEEPKPSDPFYLGSGSEDEEEEQDKFEHVGKLDNKAEILKLADRHDSIKVSRANMLMKMTSEQNLPAIKEGIRRLNALEEKEEEEKVLACGEAQEIPLPELPEDNGDLELCGAPSKDSLEDDGSEQKEASFTDEGSTYERSDSAKDSEASGYVPVGPSGLDLNPELPEMKGAIKKKGSHFVHTWHSRYLVLRNRKLLYYKSESAQKTQGCLNFDHLSATVEVVAKHPKLFVIKPANSHTVFTFKTKKPEEAKKWVEMIDIHIKASKGYSTPLNSLCSKKLYWKHDRITTRQFLRVAETGDLILFRTNCMAAKVTRSVTRSDYDHVALVLKYDNGEIVLFEATGYDGVGLCRWNVFLRSNWNVLFDKIVFRKLVADRSNKLIDDLETFVTNTVGKKYSINAKKLLQRKSVSNGIDPDDRTFFCSELVAAAYKKAGLLPPKVPSSSYYPSSFSAVRGLKLTGDAKLGEELLIDFEL